MEDSTFTTLPPSLPLASGPSTNQHRATYASERAQVLFGGYRRGDANDPERYVAAIAAVLSCYDPEIIREVTDPRTGISTHEKYRDFMPNSGQLKAYCEEIANRQARMAEYQKISPTVTRRMLPRLPPQPGCRVNTFLPSSNVRYAEVCEAIKTEEVYNWRYDAERGGIWLSLRVAERYFTLKADAR